MFWKSCKWWRPLTCRLVHSSFNREVWEAARRPENSQALRVVSSKNTLNVDDLDTKNSMTLAPEVHLTCRLAHSVFDRDIWGGARPAKNSRACRLVSNKNTRNVDDLDRTNMSWFQLQKSIWYAEYCIRHVTGRFGGPPGPPKNRQHSVLFPIKPYSMCKHIMTIAPKVHLTNRLVHLAFDRKAWWAAKPTKKFARIPSGFQQTHTQYWHISWLKLQNSIWHAD